MVYRRVAFSTRDGWIGLGPDRMRSGDVVVALAGADVLFVLRPVNHGYILVGECYVEGVLDGDFVKESTDVQPDGSKVVRNGQVFHIRLDLVTDDMIRSTPFRKKVIKLPRNSPCRNRMVPQRTT